jgi:CubicO group peptidase (beta-lactamase class C family)
MRVVCDIGVLDRDRPIAKRRGKMIDITKTRGPVRAIRALVLAATAMVTTYLTAAAAEDTRTAAFPTTEPASVGFAPDRLAFLNSRMHQIVDDGEIAGVVTLLARHGRIVSVDSYGKSNIADATPLKRDAIFRIYSQTKPITGVAMMMLFEQGKWSFDDPVSKFVPEFANLEVFDGLDTDGKAKVVAMTRRPTMRMLMTHTAGFGYGFGPFADNYVDEQIQKTGVFRAADLHDMVVKLASVPLRYQPGTKWSYSAAVDIQGYIVEKISGQRFGDFLAEHLFRPLGMKDTAFYVAPEKVARLASFYGVDKKTKALVELTPEKFPALQDFTKMPNLDLGGAGLLSTVDDYARFCQMLLNGGIFNGARILTPATVALIGSNQLPTTAAPEDEWEGGSSIGGPDLGFGVDVAVMKDPARMGKLDGAGTLYWGGAAGTWFWIDPKNDLFFVGMIQRYDSGDSTSTNLDSLSQTLVYAALVDPRK